jgi:predicted GTPase
MVDLKFERQDLKIIDLMHKRRKPIIIVINKIDQAKSNKQITEIENKITKFWDIPILKISCLKKQNIHQILEVIKNQEIMYETRIKTSLLNIWLKENISKIAPRIKFITQIETAPPKFFVDCQLEEHTQRMLKRKLMREFGFQGIPVFIQMKKK